MIAYAHTSGRVLAEWLAGGLPKAEEKQEELIGMTIVASGEGAWRPERVGQPIFTNAGTAGGNPSSFEVDE